MKRLAIAALCLFCAGCITIRTDAIVSAKATTFGLDISSDPSSGSPHVRFGLVRWFYQSIPVATNQLFAPDYHSDVDATIGLTSQSVHETFTTGITNQ